jgi:hypothetical protein
VPSRQCNLSVAYLDVVLTRTLGNHGFVPTDT